VAISKMTQSDIDFWYSVKGRRQEWNTKSQEWYDFSIMNKQWTTEEEQTLERRGQAPLVINRLKPVIRLYQSHLGARAPKIKTVPMRSDIGEITAQKLSTVFNDLFHWIWYNSNGDLLLDQVIEDFLVRGIGYFFLRWDKYGRDGMGQICIENLHPNEVFVDSESRKRDFSDASRIVISKEITTRAAETRLPEYKQKIKNAVNRYVTRDNMTSTDLTTGDDLYYYDEIYDEEEDRIRIFDVYEKRPAIKYEVVSPITGRWEILTPEEYKEFKKDDVDYVARKIYINRIFRRFYVGDIPVGKEEELPTSEYPIVPVIYQHIGNPYPMSLVSYGMDLQKEVNKRRSLLIAHATSNAGGTKMIYEAGAITNKEQTEADWARPTGWTEVNDITLLKDVAPTAIPTSLIQLEQFAKTDMEYVMGAPATSMGMSDSQTHDTFKGVLALDEFSQRNVGPSAKALYLGLKLLGKVTVDYIQGYMKTPQMIRISQPYDNPGEDFQELMLNQNVYDDKTGAIQTISNDVTVGRYDVEVVANSTSASNQAAEEERMLAYYQAGLVDDIEVYKHINIFDKQGLLARKSLIAQQQGIINQMTSQLDDMAAELDGIAKKYKDEVFSHEVTKWKKHMTEVKTRATSANDALQTQTIRAVDQLKLAQKEAKAKGANNASTSK